MKREEVIKLADEWLKSIPDIKARIRIIDIAIKNESNNIDNIDKLQNERNRLNKRLSSIIGAIGRLKEDNQRILCYKYFDKLTYKVIGLRTGHTYDTIKRRIDKSLLDIGRVLFGFEDEFWNEISIE